MTEPKYTCLLVDDDREVLQINGEYLRQKGFRVLLAEEAVGAIELIRRELVHCIVLDVMMPGMDGFAALEQIRALTQAPILFLTGRAAGEDRIRGLMQGADDYIVKPCSPEELALRLMIHIRKSQNLQPHGSVLEFPPLRIDMLGHRVYCHETELLLSNREYDLLLLLARNPGVEMTFEMIGRNLYNGYLEADRKNIMVTASRLRKKLEGFVGTEHLIETVWGKGYRFRG